METTDAAPNTMPDSVSSERSLCPRISCNASPNSSSYSRIAQRLHGREPRGAQRREEPGEQPDRQGRHARHGGDEWTHDRRHLHEVRDHTRERGAERQSEQPTHDRDDEHLGEHVRENRATGGAKSHARPELPHALHDRGEQDVRDDDPARNERHDADDEKNEIEEEQELARFPTSALSRGPDVEVLYA